MDPHAYVTVAALDTAASAAGIDSAVDHDPDGALAQAIGQATAEVDFYCAPRYGPAQLAGNAWVQSKALTLALWFLYGKRNNPRPKTLDDDYAGVIRQLEAVQKGAAAVPGAALGKGAVPTVTGQRVDLQRYPGTVTERARSTGTASGYPRRTDPGGAYEGYR